MMKKFVYAMSVALLLVISSSAFASTIKVVNISGDLINKTHPTPPDIQNFYMHFSIYTDLLGFQENIDKMQEPSRGRFVISAAVPSTGTVTIKHYDPHNGKAVALCTLKVTTGSMADISVEMVKQNQTDSVICTYQGDPKTNTAAIILAPRNETTS